MKLNPITLGVSGLLLTLFISQAGLAQTAADAYGYYNDALRYSQTAISGSSRVQGMGGVGVATGADISSGHINPAGLGLLRKGEMSITGSIGSVGSSSSYLGTTTRDSRPFLGIPNFGVVFSNAKDDLQEGDFRGGSFSISFTKTNNFQSQFNLEGQNRDNSILDALAQEGNRVGTDYLLDQYNDYDFGRTSGFNDLVGAAYFSEVIDRATYYPRDANGNRTGDTVVLPYILSKYELNKKGVSQSEIAKIRNGIYQWDFAYGGNYKDKLYFGVGLGLTRVNYRKSNEYMESFQDQALRSITIEETYSARGGGINAKGGLIFRPNDVVRLGVSFTTPTYMSINELSDGNLSRDAQGVRNETLPLLQTINKFQMLSPSRVAPGIAFFLGKKGFIAADVEILNYASARLINEPGKNFYKADNKMITNIYQTTANFKLGAEFRHEDLRFRAGYAFFGDPYTDGKITPFSTAKGLDRSRNAVTLGFGVRRSDMYFDLAVVTYLSNKTYYQTYNEVQEDFYNTNSSEGIIDLTYPGPAPIAEITNNLTTINFTIGSYFGQ